MNTTSFVKSRPFDVHRWSDHPELSNCLDDLIAEIEVTESQTGKRKRKRTAKEATHFRAAVRSLVLDLFVAWKTDPDLQIAVSLMSSSFNPGARYHRLYFSYKPFKAAFDRLKELGYLVVDKPGNFDRRTGKGYRTRVRATRKLIEKLVGRGRLSLPRISRASDEEVIILKDDSKALKDYDDTPATMHMRKNLQCINGVLSNSWIDLYLTDDEFEALNERLKSSGDKPAIDFTARTLHRVFNNGSFEQGGRFYGGWWQTIPREYRPYITINDELTTELDYSGMHARILYALEGERLGDEDPFDAIGFGPEHRQTVKETFYALVNAGDGGVRPAAGFDEEVFGVSWDEFQKRIIVTHQPIQRYFKTGFGLKLQYLDSQIAEKVMLRFAKQGIPCLPMHDSFIMHRDQKDDLELEMSAAFLEVIGVGSIITVKEPANVIQFNCSDNNELGTIIHYNNIYDGYLNRIEKWRQACNHRKSFCQRIYN